MIESDIKIHELISSEKIKIKNLNLKKVVQSYSLYLITKGKLIEKEEKQNIENNIKESKLLIISSYEKNNEEEFLFLGFEKTIIILEQSSIAFFHNLLSINDKLPVCFMSNKMIEIKNPEIEATPIFFDEIKKFNQHFFIKGSTKYASKLYSNIVTCISSYLIKKAYLLLNENRIEKFLLDLESHWIPKTIQKTDYIELRIVGAGSIFMSILVYYITLGELCVIKKPNEIDSESSKLVERETSNYRKIMHPFIPKYYGEVENTSYFVIEFINGITLDEINKDELKHEEKIIIIFELMEIIKYFHDNKLIYRDLKPNNIIINKNKDAVLIDFDRLIEYDSESNIHVHTIDSAASFSAPEISLARKFSYKSDIYSLGKVISYIINSTESDELLKMNIIINMCLNEIAEERPSISDLIQRFTSLYQSKIEFHSLHGNFENHLKFIENILEILKNNDLIEKDIKINLILGLYYYKTQNISKSIHYYSLAADKNDSKAQYNLGIIYYNGNYVTCDITKAIHYFMLAADQNHPQALYNLGFIYQGKLIKSDMKKSIHYYTLAADLNHPQAQYNLGFLYYDGKYVTRDINKSIHYYSLAADQNDSKSQYKLGVIYYEGNDVARDMNKAIHYLLMAADQNHPDSQYTLGFIYYEGKFVKNDINKAIRYFSLAADQNHVQAQYNLGVIYHKGKFVTINIDKAIHYYTLAADQNHSESQFNLGLIYLEGQFVKNDINKAIHYFSLAADQNHARALFNLGVIYHKGKFIKPDIDKAIQYYTLAADQNDLYSQFNLAVLYEEGKYTDQDMNKAIHYYLLAANQNNPDAQFKIGHLYHQGVYTPCDIKKAIYYYSLAANQNHAEAQFGLGSIYFDQEYGFYDINKAIYYFTLAANQDDQNAKLILGIIYSGRKYGSIDINKAIQYYSYLANQNDSNAQFFLGLIYDEGTYVTRDINKSIYYYTLAENQNNQGAQYNLGLLYYEGQYVKRDIKKASYYFSLAASHEDPDILYNLGLIYLKGEYIPQDISKAIHYLSISANKNNPDAQYNLGYLYYDGKHIPQDINKAIQYISLAANQNNIKAQYNLGLIYYEGKFFPQNIQKGKYYLILASKNGNKLANFAHAFLLHNGIYIKRDIKAAIHYYKDASSFNIPYAKNNLGIIYKHGYEGIEKNLGYAIEYFENAIQQVGDYLSMYNLAHIYIYDETINHDIDKSIDLLIISSNYFIHSMILLGLVLIKKFGYNCKKIKQKIEKHAYNLNDLSNRICIMMSKLKLYDKSIFESKYESYKTMDFLYNIQLTPIQFSDFEKMESSKSPQKYPLIKDITNLFYEGFGINLFTNS